MNHEKFYTTAFNMGVKYASTHTYSENPLSYEYADMVTTGEIYLQIEEELGTIPTDVYDSLLDEWEAGYEEYWDTKQAI